MEKNAAPTSNDNGSQRLRMARADSSAPPEFFLSANWNAPEEFEAAVEEIASALDGERARILSMQAFGASGAQKERLINALGQGSRSEQWPVLWVNDAAPAPLGGVHVWAIASDAVTPVELNGDVVGSCFEKGGLRFCNLAGIGPIVRDRPRAAQARETFQRLEQALETIGMDFHNTIRTWLFNTDILEWYDAFNETRDAFYQERSLFHALVPASTCVGGGNASGAALTSALLAVEPIERTDFSAQPVASPLQCPALDYGSSFSRAVELGAGNERRLYVSGTASIAPDGRTLHTGDVRGQIAHTMESVEAILESRGMDWSHVARGTVYFRNAQDAPAFLDYLAERSLPPMPLVLTENTICRDDLLFEIEVDGVGL